MRWLLWASPFSFIGKNKRRFFHVTVKQQLYSSPFSSYAVGNGQMTIASALAFSAESKSLVLGTKVHSQLIKLGCRNDTFIQNNLIRMYMKCECLDDALGVFGEMPEKNLVSWTLIISGAVQNGASEVGLAVFLEMRRNGFVPNEFALGSIIKVCSAESGCGGIFCYEFFGLYLHALSLKIGIDKNPFVRSSLMHMYAMFGTIDATEKVFEHEENFSDIACWNAMIGGYAQNGFGFEALKTMSMMHSRGMTLDEFTFINSLNGCSVLGDLELGEQIHGLVIGSGMDMSTSVQNSLVAMYFKGGGKDSASRVFNKMVKKDVVSWNTVLSGFSQDCDVQKVAELFQSFMILGFKPNRITFSILFRLCGEVSDLGLGLQIYCLSFRFGYTAESHVASSIVFMFSRCGETRMARSFFDSLSSRSISILNEIILGYNLIQDEEAVWLFSNIWQLCIEVDWRTFSSTIEACFNTGYPQLGRQIHGIIIKSGFSSHGHVCGSLIRGYITFGLVKDSFAFFYGLNQLDLVCCGTMISALVHQGFNNDAIRFLNCRNWEGEKLDDFILSSIFTSCANLASLQLTKSVHSLVIKLGFEKYVSVASAAIDAYSKSGDLESAVMTCSLSSSADAVLFNCMIMAYAHHGQVLEAMRIFDKMRLDNLQPSQSTFVSVLSACSHKGLVDIGHTLFESISSDYGMNPSRDNYGCYIDLLSRNGLLEDAKSVISAMPFPSWPAILRSMLNGCRIHGNKPLGEWAAKELSKLVPADNAAYILMSRMHSEDGDWEAAARVRKGMVDEGNLKPMGCSWVEV